MTAILEALNSPHAAWIALSIFLLGMSKGGFPVGSAALPLMILVWPQQTHAARAAVAFMLPMLCVMDLCALAVYRRHIRWNLLRPLFPGMLAGVAAGTLLFVHPSSTLVGVSDRVLKGLIVGLGLVFVLYQAARARLLRRLEARRGSRWMPAVTGAAAGLTSTMAHAAGPVMQMYLLPMQLPKLEFAATHAGFFLVLNLVKLGPFLAAGRITRAHAALGLALLPVIPLGVVAGYGLVHLTPAGHYRRFIYAVLAITSGLLLVKALAGA